MNIRVPAETLVPYLSASQLAGYLRCPKQYWFRYIAKKPPSHVGVALPFGRAWGNIIAHYLKESEPGHLVPLPELVELFREDFEREVADAQAGVLFEEDETTATLVETAARMLEAFQEKVPLPEAVLGVEMAFSVHLAHPGEPDDPLPVPLVGAIDVLVLEAGKSVIWELKSSKKKYGSTQFDYEMLQPAAYVVGARSWDLEDPEVVVVVTTKSKRPDVQLERLRRHPTDEIELFDLAQNVLRGVEAGVFPRSRSWACKTCPYLLACSP